MNRNRILASIATIAIISAAPALAKPGGGGGMGGGAANAGAGPMGGISGTGSTMRDMGRANSQGPANASPNALERVNGNSVLSTTTDDAGSTTRIRGQDRIRDNATDDDDDDGTETNVSDRALEARTNSQGPANANVNGLVNANPNSVLSGAGVTTLTGLTTGLTVNNSAGTSIGTVTEVLTNRSGAVVGIRVDLTGDGGIVFIPATTLSIDGTIVTTSSTNF